MAKAAEETVAVELLVEIVVHTDAEIGSGGAEEVVVFLSFARAISQFYLKEGEVFFLEVDARSRLHVGKLGSHALHGQSADVHRYGRTGQ